MFNDITVGQYIPGNSVLHRIYPALKIIMAILYVIVLFFANKPLSIALVAVFTAALTVLSGIHIRIMLKGIKPMIWIIIITALINVFMTPGNALWGFQIFALRVNITYEGLYAAAVLSVRLVFLVTGTSLLTLTTSPLQLTDGIEKLLRPLRRFKVPSFEIAMMMTIAIRFIPTLAEETDKIMKAQTARGADFQTGNIVRRAKAMIPLLVPLFVSAFRRADELATAMEARCFTGGNGRTRMKESKMEKSDVLALIVFILGAAAVIAAEYVTAKF